MIVFQIMYPYSENREFDMTYYLNNHLATARELLGTACLKVKNLFLMHIQMKLMRF